MRDLISREAAIDVVNDCGICIQKILDLPSAEPKWIPVTEQLPGTTKKVLIAKRISPDVTVVDTGRYFDPEKTWYSKNFEIVNVVAWMPSPKSYEEAEK